MSSGTISSASDSAECRAIPKPTSDPAGAAEAGRKACWKESPEGSGVRM